jgi:hypothetical protein
MGIQSSGRNGLCMFAGCPLESQFAMGGALAASSDAGSVISPGHSNIKAFTKTSTCFIRV